MEWSGEELLQRIIYIIRFILSTRQVDPVVQQAHAGFVLPGNQTVGTFPIDRAFVLELHAIGFIKAVFQIGDDKAQGLQSLPLSWYNRVTVNAALQKQNREEPIFVVGQKKVDISIMEIAAWIMKQINTVKSFWKLSKWYLGMYWRRMIQSYGNGL